MILPHCRQAGLEKVKGGLLLSTAGEIGKDEVEECVEDECAGGYRLWIVHT